MPLSPVVLHYAGWGGAFLTVSVPSLIGLFIWFVLTAFLELVAIVFFARHIFPNLPMWPHFSASMYGIGLTH